MPDEQKEKIGAKAEWLLLGGAGYLKRRAGRRRGMRALPHGCRNYCAARQLEGAVLLKKRWDAAASPEALNFLSLAECRGIGFHTGYGSGGDVKNALCG